ncbi:unnamed protein product [Mytilus coruscus]|uniref:Uncharacterized protein n=1 Tax=Mytilus coruscus TaxID=42192 RepID=A0A6J8EVR1_MYTCO|nr:unnamed protein product [Mytilus coruscus]
MIFRKIEIIYRVAFRRSSGSHSCDENSIANGTLSTGEGSLVCQSGCLCTITAMSYCCTDFSTTEDWTTGIRSVKYTFPVSNGGNGGWRKLDDTCSSCRSNQSKPDDPLTTIIPNGEVSTGLLAGLAVGGLALFRVTAFAIARCLCCCKSAQVWANSKKPERSKINTNVNSDNFKCFDDKGEYVSAIPAKSHAFSNDIY